MIKKKIVNAINKTYVRSEGRWIVERESDFSLFEYGFNTRKEAREWRNERRASDTFPYVYRIKKGR